ncbi:hypothetical protein FC34_GL001276 [Lacticaseibacillus brantae DSM 23927]|uniref:Uncharacterized protein n=1 Tax=Lacticaseibacillus brantae DSM 23927 TaxID=1423727 RepID=A0A0R2AXW8_9LACO|nr:hypothetical protein FC34_GL001276 [Lacticaseibacillus brantae DSM 23927]
MMLLKNLKLVHQIGWFLIVACVVSAFLIPTWLIPIVDGEDIFNLIMDIFERTLTSLLVWIVALVLGVKFIFLK